MNLPDVEVIFQAFVRNANAVAAQARTSQAPPRAPRAPSAPPPLAVSLGDFASAAPSPPLDARIASEIEAQLDPELRAEGARPLDLGDAASHIMGDMASLEEESAEPVELVRKKHGDEEQTQPELEPGGPGSNTQRIEAEKVVPDVASVAPPPAPVREGSELGEIPPRELERTMADMQVLLRYGHKAEVGRRLDELHSKYPNDLLLLRRIAEFHVQTGSLAAAKECLFKLATVLFERRNVHGMRSALEQVLVLEPRNPRAHRLLSLLERRQDPA